MTFFLEHAAVFLALTATACGAGWWAVRRLPVGGRLERFVLATALGLVVLAQVGLLLGLAGWLRPGPVLAVAVLTLLILLILRGGGGALSREAAAKTPSPTLPRADARERAPATLPPGTKLLISALALAPFAVMSLYPPTGFDATLYHLPFARAFVESGGVPFLPELRFPVFPQANEVLFALVMLFSDDVAAHGVELLSSLLTAALLFVWGRDTFGTVAGWGAAAVFLGNPIVAHLSGDAYVESGLTLFTTAALYAVWRWRRGEEGIGANFRVFGRAEGALSRASARGRVGEGASLPAFSTPSPTLPRFAGEGATAPADSKLAPMREGGLGWLALAAAFASAAAASKYLGLFFLGLVGLAVLFPARGSGWGLRWRALVVAGAVTLAVAGPWYARLLAWTGNPLFPFAPDLFGESDWDPLNFRTFASLTASDLPPEPPTSLARYGERAVSLVRLPWDVVFERDRFGRQPPYSPVYLIALPLALLLACRDPRLRPPLLIAGIYAFVCLALPPDSRYLLPAAPLVSLAAGAVLARALTLPALSCSQRRWLAAAVCAGCFLPAWCYGIYRIQRQGPLPVTAERREEYLARRLPLYPAVAYLNRRYGGETTVYGLWAEEMIYYSESRYLGDWYGPASYRRLLRNVRSAADLHGSLRRLGAGVLLVAAGRKPLPVPEDAEFHRLFRQVYADPNARVFELMRLPG